MPLLFVISHLPFSMFLKNEKAGCISGNYKATINHLLFMGDVTFYTKKHKLTRLRIALRKLVKYEKKSKNMNTVKESNFQTIKELGKTIQIFRVIKKSKSEKLNN